MSKVPKPILATKAGTRCNLLTWSVVSVTLFSLCLIQTSSAQNVAQYCKDTYGSSATITLLDRQDAFAWRCGLGAASFAVNVEELCHQQFGSTHRALLLDRNDAFAWRCTTTPPQSPLWSGPAEIDPSNLQIVRSPYSGGVTAIAEVGRVLRGIERLPTIHPKDLTRRIVSAPVASNAIMIGLSPQQEDYLFQWNRRLDNTAEAIQQLGFEKAETDAGNNPAGLTVEEPERSQFAIAWSLAAALPKEVMPALPPFESTMVDLNTAPPIPGLTGAKAMLLRDVSNSITGAPKSPALAAMVQRLMSYRIWHGVAEPALLAKLRTVLIGSTREDLIRDVTIPFAPPLPKSLLPNSERLLVGAGGRMQLVVPPYNPTVIPRLHFYWRFVTANSLMNDRDRDFVRRLPGGAAASAEQQVASLIHDLEDAWRRKLNQNALQIFAANAMSAVSNVPEPSRPSVAASFVQANFPPTPASDAATRTLFIDAAKALVQRAAAEFGPDPRGVEWAILESQRSFMTSPFSMKFMGPKLTVEPDQRNTVGIVQDQIRITPNFKGVDLELQINPDILTSAAGRNPVLAPFLLRWFRQAAALKTSFDFTFASNRVLDLRRAVQQLAAAELETAMDDLAEGRRLQQDWWDIEKIVREGATDYQFGHVTLQDDAALERTVVAKGDQIARGDEVATVRPLFDHRIKIVLPAEVTLAFGTLYEAVFDCDDRLAVSPAQRRALLALPEAQRTTLKAALGGGQNQLRKALRFEASLVSAPSATGAPWILRAYLPQARRRITLPVADAAIADAAAAAGFNFVDTSGGKRLLFDAGYIDSVGTCRVNLDFADQSVKTLVSEEAAWRRSLGP